MISPVYVLFMTIPCAARGSGEHPQSFSALCPREQQAVEDWQVVGAQLWQDHHPQPHKKRDKGQNVQGLCEDAGLFLRGPTGTCSCASINPPTEHLYILPILYLGRAQSVQCPAGPGPFLQPQELGTSGQAWTLPGEPPLSQC